jgi:hypothetical protein
MKIFTDSTQRSLIALDFNNNRLWQTNPWSLQSFASYDSSMNTLFRSNRIIKFFLASNKSKKSPFVYLRFLYSPIAAVIERKTGKFHLIGVM